MIRNFTFCFVCPLVVGVCVTVVGGGCVELAAILGEGQTDGATNGAGSDGSGIDTTPPDTDDSDSVPVVHLYVSNANPFPGEEVVFTCRFVRGDSSGVTYAFLSSGGRLIVNERTGTASYIVDQSDAGAEFSVTCTATNDFGTSDTSNRQTIIVMQQQ